MDADKTARLDAALAAIQMRWGAGSVRLLNNLPSPQPGVLTGFATLDTLLAPGGIPRGAVTELLGVPTSGMTTLAYNIAREGQGTGGYIIYIDVDATFDPAYAAACGIALERLLLARPESDFEALGMAYDLLVSGRELLVLLDLGGCSPDARQLRRIHAALSRSGCIVLLLLNTLRPLAESTAALRLLVQRRTWLWHGAEIGGYGAEVTLLKSRCHAGAVVSLDFWLDSGAVPR